MATQLEVNNFLANAFVTKSTPAGVANEVNIAYLPGSVGQTIDVYIWAVDAAGSVSYTKIASNVTLRLDTDNPVVTEESYGAGFTCHSADEIPFSMLVTDATSGVSKYEIFVGPNMVNEVFIPVPIKLPTKKYIHDVVDVGSGAGSKSITVKIYDQADNIETRTFSVNRGADTVTWDTLNANRSSVSPFIAKGRWDATVTSGSSKLCAYFATADFLNPPTPHPKNNSNYPTSAKPFDISIGEQTSTGQDFECIVAQSNQDTVIVYVALTTPGCVAAKVTSIPAVDYSSLSIGNPTVSIKEQYEREYTKTLTNGYHVKATPGNAGSYGAGDLIIGYAMSESPTAPAGAPTYDEATQTFTATGAAWTAVSKGTSRFDGVIDYAFAGGGTPPYAGVMKTVYVHIATFGHCGYLQSEYGSSASVTTFKASTQIVWIDDQVGPILRNVSVKDASDGVNQACTGNGSVASSTFTRPADVKQSTGIVISGFLEDTQTNIIRYIVTSSSTPPPFVEYSTTHPYSLAWTRPSPRSHTENFTATVAAMPPNGFKQFFIHSVDSCFNHSTNPIFINLDDPAYVIQPTGTTAGDAFKFEGNSSDHVARKSIASMFGDGVHHQGYISKRTPDVTGHRVHKLSEYRGMRVVEDATKLQAELPAPSDPLKFSDFIGKSPRFFNLRITPHVSSVSTFDAPTYVGDVRKLALILDVDTGDHSASYIPAATNRKVVEIDAKWFITHHDLPSDTLTPVVIGQTPAGGILNFTFSQEGVYFIVVYDSFGNSIQTTYRIYPTTAILPPVQPPIGDPTLSPLPEGTPTPVPPPPGIPIDGVDPPQTGSTGDGGTGTRVYPRDPVHVPTKPPTWPLPDGGGNPTTGHTTDFIISFSVDQICLAVDACLLIDRSGSYVSGFSNQVYTALTDTLNNIANFSKDRWGNVNARFGLCWYWNPSPGGIIYPVQMPSISLPVTAASMAINMSAIDAGVSSYKDSASGGREPKYEAVSRIANEGACGDWRPTALKMILLYSDEPDSPDQGGSSKPQYVEQPTHEKFYINALLNNGIALVLYDAGAGAAGKNHTQSCMTQTEHLGSLVHTLGTGASSSDISNAVNAVFEKYKDNLYFTLEPDITTPAIFKSVEAHAGIHGSTTCPIPYADLKDSGGTKWAVFRVKIDHDQLYALGASYIDTMVTIRNSIGLPIARKQIQIAIF